MDETPFQPRRRQPRDYALVLLQGFGMGAADVVPGVSGGTMAFIFGIYEELIEGIRSFDLATLRLALALNVKAILARVPLAGETRGNLAAGGSGRAQALSDRDRWIAEQVGPALVERGLLFAGLDVIGDYLTEINVTSPTCLREIDAGYDLDIAGQLMDCIAQELAGRC